jgi:chromosome partitioning protein
MPIIVFASSKGGAGKSTSAVLLATTLAEAGGTTTLIDADPNRPVSKWAKRAEIPAKMTVVADVREDSILNTIDDAASRAAFVVVDLEGTASMMVGIAVSRADLVIIPMQGSHLDAEEGVKALALVKVQEQVVRHPIPAAVLFTRTSSAIKPRGLTTIATQIKRAGVATLNTQIHEREAYRAMFAFGQTLSRLDSGQVPNLPAAVANAKTFMTEVITLLKAPAQPRAAQVA